MIRRIRAAMQIRPGAAPFNIPRILQMPIYVRCDQFFTNFDENAKDKLVFAEEDAECAICLAEITMGEVIVWLDCKHYFHAE